MRRLRGPAGALALLVLFGSCDTTQPVQTGEQTLEIAVRTTNSLVQTFNVWDIFNDDFTCEGVVADTLCTDPMGNPDPSQCVGLPGATGVCAQDRVPDDLPSCSMSGGTCTTDADCPTGEMCNPADGVPDFLVPFCELVVDVSGVPVTEPALDNPWTFTIRVRLIEAGGRQARDVTSPASLNPDANLTGYDDRVRSAPQCPSPANRPFSCRSDPVAKKSYANQRRLNAANRLLFENDGLNDSCLPSIMNRGDPAIDAQPQPFRVQVNKGDTVIVELRLPDPAPAGNSSLNQPSLVATTAVDGQVVTVDGETVTDPTAGAGITYSFTVR